VRPERTAVFAGDQAAAASRTGSNNASLAIFSVGNALALVVAQHAAVSPLEVSGEQTPVSGRTNWTLRADSQSPAIAAATERTCSYPVRSRNVGARPSNPTRFLQRVPLHDRQQLVKP
jgi:hypothetical protein